MGLYHYCYLDEKGKKRTSVLEAENEREAKETLRLQKCLVLSLEPAKRGQFTFSKKPILQKEHLITFTDQLAELLSAGMPLYESLASLEEQYRNERFGSILQAICEKIKGGASLSSAFKQYPDSFSNLYCAMVAAGEAVGALDAALKKLALMLSKQRKLKKMLVTSLLYPALLCSFSFVVVLALLCFVIPSLEALFEDRSVNGFTSFVMSVSHFITKKWMFYLPSLLCLFAALFLFVAKRKNAIQKNLLYVPFLGTLLIQSAIARFSRTMGTLLSGGVSIIAALQTARQVIGNPAIEEIIAHAEAKIIEGSLLSQELKKAKWIPSLVSRMLAIGEEGGNSAAMLNKIADFYESELEKSLSRITALAQPVILLLMGVIVGAIMLAVLLPLSDVNAFI